MNQISVAELKVIVNSVVNNSIRIGIRFNVKEVFTYEEFILVREKNKKEKRRYRKKCCLNHRDVQICAGMSKRFIRECE